MHAFLAPNASHQPLFGLPSVRTRNVLPTSATSRSSSRESWPPLYQQWAPRSQSGQRPPINVLAEDRLANRGVHLKWGAYQVPPTIAIQTAMPKFTANTSATNLGDEQFFQ
jgi:hypothetical protein